MKIAALIFAFAGAFAQDLSEPWSVDPSTLQTPPQTSPQPQIPPQTPPSTSNPPAVAPLEWRPCAQKSRSSYLNLTFTPWPIQRNAYVNVTLQGYLVEAIADGTTLELKSWHNGIRFVPGPRFKLDVCSFIQQMFKESSNPISCPMNPWAVKMVLFALQQSATSGMQAIMAQGDLNSTDSDTQSGGGWNKTPEGVGMQVWVPGRALKGNYRATLQLTTAQGVALTCAQTTLVIE